MKVLLILQYLSISSWRFGLYMGVWWLEKFTDEVQELQEESAKGGDTIPPDNLA